MSPLERTTFSPILVLLRLFFVELWTNMHQTVPSAEWCLRKEDKRKIPAAEMGWLRRILRVARRDRMRNEVIVKCYIQKKRCQQNKEEATDLVWPCYKNGRKTTATKSNALPYISDSECRKTAKKWIDNIKDDIADLGLNIRTETDSARDRRRWRHLVTNSSPTNG